ncbi:tyrosine-type recombinase/integrase [Nitrosovibrio tenuis]|uniref:Site-specific recombinase XerD n=1 Tax=Nitrosovibrio tenuis TaxID=1233 RepID=A0A1H7LIB0_9PROT|nr:tyrosine-type recombinase/integrase [Nitrosovibrio tenuis]SEK98631.1 Site-specific recombinase XerD [Nitrosovibrio tenuis]
MPKLTKSVVDAIPYPETGQIFYRDSEIKGFGLRVGTSSKVYIAEGKVNSKTIRVSIGHHGIFTAEQARQEAKNILGMIARDINPNDVSKAKRAQSVTLSEVFEAYLKARGSLKSRTVYDYKRLMKTYLADWQTKPLVEISKDQIERKHREIGERSPAQANLTMRFVRALLNFAIGKYEDSAGNPIIANNPTKRLSQTRSWYRVDRRNTVIKAHDLPQWFRAVNNLKDDALGRNRIKDYLLLLLFTGLRREEGLSLAWSQVDLKAKTLTIPDPKNRQPHVLPLSNFLHDLLMKRYLERTDSPFVFPGDGIKGYLNEPRKQMNKVIEESGVEFTLHDLRRTFITVAESLDISGYALKRLANHKMANDVTAGYIISDVQRLREPMQRVTNFLLTSMNAVTDTDTYTVTVIDTVTDTDKPTCAT